MNNLKTKLSGSTTRYALIDADSVLYATALGAEACIKGKGEEEDQFFQIKDGEECYKEVVRRLEALVQEVNASDALICLTPPGRCYRYSLLDSYKANRKAIRRPEVLRPLQALVASRKPFRVLSVRGLEADDICGISQTSLQKAGMREPIIVSIDKDMLQVPGLNYSWLTAARERSVGVVREVTMQEADRMHLYQTLVGDTVDNYTGCPGVGPVKANKILNECMETHGELDWRWIVRAFETKGLDESYALTQARVARILRDTDWDPITKEVTLWTPGFLNSSIGCVSATASTTFTGGGRMDASSSEALIPTKAIINERTGATLH
jgi:hypothetical protein